jgi:hypothetical protein
MILISFQDGNCLITDYLIQQNYSKTRNTKYSCNVTSCLLKAMTENKEDRVLSLFDFDICSKQGNNIFFFIYVTIDVRY